MLNDLIMDTALQAHHEIARSRAVCHICHTRCVNLQFPLGLYPYTAFSTGVAQVERSSIYHEDTITSLFVVHTPSVTPQITVSPARADTPSSALEAKVTNGSSGTGTNTPTSVKDGNLYLDCVHCSRQVRSPTFSCFF
jgi:hypothetical protein